MKMLLVRIWICCAVLSLWAPIKPMADRSISGFFHNSEDERTVDVLELHLDCPATGDSY